MVKKNILAFAVLFVGSAAGAADNFLPQTDVAQTVIGAHPIVAAAEARLAEAEAEARLRKVGEHEFHLNGSYIRRDVRGEGTFGEWDSSISRAVRLPGKAKADRKIGALGIVVAENARDDARHQVALLLKDYWFEWLEASLQVEVDQSATETYRRELKAVERRHELKEAALLDVDDARSALAVAEAGLHKSSARKLEAERAIRAMFPGLVLPLQVPEIQAPEPTEQGFDVWKDRILSRSHELRMAEKAVEQQMALARRTKLDKVADPTVGVRFFSERGGDEQGVGILFSMPFGSSRRSAKTDVQRARVLAAEAQARQTRLMIEEVADRDITRAEAGVRVWQQAAVALDASKKVVARVRRAVEIGERDLTELLRVLKVHYEVRREEALARLNAQDAITQLQIDSHEIWIATHHDHEE